MMSAKLAKEKSEKGRVAALATANEVADRWLKKIEAGIAGQADKGEFTVTYSVRSVDPHTQTIIRGRLRDFGYATALHEGQLDVSW